MSTNIADYVSATLTRRGRWGVGEILFWLIAAATLYFLPERHLILNEIAIIGLFAISLDLILGYAGIVSLGHAAFFGLGAYTAGILARNGIADPLLGLGAAAITAAILGFVTSFLVLRGSDLTKLMVTLGVALVLGEIANQASWLTGGADGLQGVTMGPILGLFEFDIFGTTAYAYSLTVTFLLFIVARRIVVSPYGLSLRSIRDNPLKARAVGIPVNRRLIAIYTLAAAYAGVAGALLAQTTQFVSLDVLAFHRSADVMLVLVIGGVGYLYGGLIGAIVFKVLQDVISAWTPQYWQFWIGLILVIIVLAGRERLTERVRTLWKGVAGRTAKSPDTLPKTSAREV
ncbi:branched-chain amino acid ABC transporter permease [Microvirga arabica]|uniref:Branched-chain amino acid ABC transporter permease n=1 Tax=Microvirga arabica TaxID=1128671 RepID=A0ABV6YGK4_9HYPH|nr:branched-chain amino acid ABC transporter permease [Microvirga arabica]MBM1169427.1 branched-chain amino acid ABC transporter permease [Microvirga arabica]